MFIRDAIKCLAQCWNCQTSSVSACGSAGGQHAVRPSIKWKHSWSHLLILKLSLKNMNILGKPFYLYFQRSIDLSIFKCSPWIWAFPNIFKRLILTMCIECVCISVWVCTHEWRCPQRPGEGAKATGAGVTGSCDCLPGAGSWTLKEKHLFLTAETSP
jgi:hypothetical protein